MASKLSPVGAEVDDQSMTLVNSPTARSAMWACWTSPGVFAVRVFGSKGLMHDEIDFGTWDTPDELHKTSTLYIQRGKDGYGKRQEFHDPGERHVPRRARDVRRELPHAAGRASSTPDNGNVAVAVVYAALRSIEEHGQAVRDRRRDGEAARAPPRRKEAAMLPSRYFAS